jgi:hypothetical protein
MVMVDLLEPSNSSQASSGRRGRGSLSPARWGLLVVLCAVTAAALPLTPFAWNTSRADVMHGGNVHIEECIALMLWFGPLPFHRFATVSAGSGAAVASFLLLVSVIAWALG